MLSSNPKVSESMCVPCFSIYPEPSVEVPSCISLQEPEPQEKAPVRDPEEDATEMMVGGWYLKRFEKVFFPLF